MSYITYLSSSSNLYTSLGKISKLTLYKSGNRIHFEISLYMYIIIIYIWEYKILYLFADLI